MGLRQEMCNQSTHINTLSNQFLIISIRKEVFTHLDLNEYASEMISDFDKSSTLTSLHDDAPKIVEECKTGMVELDQSKNVNGTPISKNDGTVDDSIQSVRSDTIDYSYSVFAKTHKSQNSLFIFPKD
jgi:hypothetical protein